MAERPRPHREMMEKSHIREAFFSVKNVPPPRPDSVHTEFMETDWEEDDILSELDEGDSSPRLSLDSVSIFACCARATLCYRSMHQPMQERVWLLT
jgi:hypothetical protein